MKVNGEEMECSSISSILKELKIDPATVCVMKNESIYPRERWEEIPSAEDEFEILRFVGGGAYPAGISNT